MLGQYQTVNFAKHLFLVMCFSSAALADEEPKRLLVMEFSHTENLSGDLSRTLTELVTARIDEVSNYRTVSGTEIQKLVELEGEKSALGCDDSSCLAEVAGAMGASRVVFGRLSKLGNTLVLQLGLYDADKAEAVARKTLKAKDLDAIAASLDATVDELVGVSVEEPPAPVEEEAIPILPYSLMGIGAVAVVGGGALLGIGLATTANVEESVDVRKGGQGMSLTGIGIAAVGVVVLATGAWLSFSE